MVTSEQVARLAGVSRATVSRALNGSPKVSEKARLRVQEAIAALGYEPDVVAQSLVRQRSRTIALCLFSGEKGVALAPFAQTQHYFYLDMLNDVEQAISAQEYDLLLPSAPSVQKSYVRSLQMRRVAGVLAISLGPNDPRIRELIAADLPTVFVDSIAQGECATYVTSDNSDGSRQATEHLLQLGHKRIAVIAGSLVGSIAMERLLGCQRTLAQAGLSLDSGLIVQGGWNTEEAYQATTGLLARRRDFTAILAGSDLMAIGILRALHERGIRVPEEVSVIGFDDVNLSRYTEPPLTTVRQSREEMSGSAVQLLIKMIEENEVATPIIVPTRLIVRASTGAAPW
ncbi:MAG: LacI family DNA-binding transcriptional regulator [Ktedonobacteraceae bacterium]